MTLWSLCMNALQRIIASRITEHTSNFLEIFPLLVAQNCHGAPVVQKILRQVDAKVNLTPEHKANRMESVLTFLQRYHDEVLEQIITNDEIWVAQITPETKQQSMH